MNLILIGSLMKHIIENIKNYSYIEFYSKTPLIYLIYYMLKLFFILVLIS